jgi:hypothetical protein
VEEGREGGVEGGEGVDSCMKIGKKKKVNVLENV